MDSYISDIQNSLYDTLVNYIDIDFTLWLTWLLTPLLITFVLPLIIVILLYTTALILYVYKWHWNRVRTTFGQGDKWGAARKAVAALWDAHGWIWHGYEVTGLDNLNNNEPGLIIYYHGAIPIDLYYFITKVLLFKNRLVHTVADYFLFKIPGFSIIAEGMNVIPGTVQTCSTVLKDGNLLAIAPGGVYESQFSHNYNLMWKKRLGFAKVAIDAKVPIIPMFTENVREAFRTVSFGKKLFLKIYAATKIPVAPIYGGFPVKMITHVGKPIPYDPNLSPEDLQAKVAQAINELVIKHQRLPGSITHALLDRIPYLRLKNDLVKHK
ncbi:DGAT1/2-independent enzyme synthesizing storage lipids isoform X2 [Onthophagus taurus]|uniref:DGAT1/2-independent enzyme synthesizing storage lipids isoform X2 n=1 Tax=Onthophagus taurus TaxID=166361 RepID=UPI000C20AA9B|nr:transmembrane protein 68 [Onthophagus taurus]